MLANMFSNVFCASPPIKQLRFSSLAKPPEDMSFTPEPDSSIMISMLLGGYKGVGRFYDVDDFLFPFSVTHSITLFD